MKEYKKIKCKVCGKSNNPKNGNEAQKKFCSKKCKNYSHNWNTKNKKNFCLDCSKQITLNSKRCMQCAFKKRDLNKEKNGRWKGGTSEGYQIKIYRGILESNGVNLKKCSFCGILKKDAKRMCIHHLDNNHKNNLFDNLISLCSKCHLGIHNRKPKVKLICLSCKKSFYVREYTKYTRKYCSKSCSVKVRNKKYWEKKNVQRD